MILWNLLLGCICSLITFFILEKVTGKLKLATDGKKYAIYKGFGPFKKFYDENVCFWWSQNSYYSYSCWYEKEEALRILKDLNQRKNCKQVKIEE